MDVRNYSDEQLVHSLEKGSAAAITEIYNRYWEKLLAIGYSHTKDRSAAEEIVQEVLINLWDRRQRLKIDSLPNYLAKSVKYAVFNSLRREKRRMDIAAQNFISPAYQLNDEKIDLLFLEEYINGVVDKLPPKCRIVYKHSRELGQSIPEISRNLSVSEKTVEAHLSKALKAIKYSLQQFGLLILTVFFILILKSR